MKPPLRFSLLGLFALVTIVALAVSLYLANSRLAVAQAEVQQLRRETGHLTIDDPTQVHIINVPTTCTSTATPRQPFGPAGHFF